MISSLFRYPGGKAKLAKIIAGNLSDFLVKHPNYEYREPMVGGASIALMLLAHPSVKKVWINDKDYSIACIWTAVTQYPDQLCNKISLFKPSVESFHEFQKFLKSEKSEKSVDVIDVAFKKIALHQISYSGLGTKSGGPLGGSEQDSEYTIDCRWNPRTIISRIKRLHKILKLKLRYGICTSYDYEILLDSPENAVLYLDPPYFVKGDELYEVGFSKDDHKRLADMLVNLQSPWVLSYDDCEEIRKLYDWAVCREVSANYTINQSRQKTELLICSEKYKSLGHISRQNDLF